MKCRMVPILIVAWLVVVPARAEDARILMLGNSYTQQNDLDQRVASALAEAVPDWFDVYGVRLANGGWNLADHAAEADGSNGNTQWRQALVTGADAGSWDWVFLQDQSQVPGFPQTEIAWQESRDGALILAGLIADGGGETVFLLTWGRRDGDTDNQWLYPDYPTMQDLLLDGYLAYAEAVANAGHVAWIAPAGLAFQAVYDDLVAAGEDPTAEGSVFHALYSEDGSHPSGHGSYLAAMAVAVGLTGRSVAAITYPADVDAATAAVLQDAADRSVLGDPFGTVPYRWAHEWADWTDPADVQSEGRVVSDTITRPLVRVSTDSEALGGLSVGADHGERGVGDGRIWIEGGTLMVSGLLAIGDAGSGEMDLRGGRVSAEELSLGADGELAFTVDENDAEIVTISGMADLAGSLSVVLADGAELGATGEIALVTADLLSVNLAFTSIPDGFDLEAEPSRLLLQWGGEQGDDDSAATDDDDSAASADDDTSGETDDDDGIPLADGSSGCGCLASGAGQPGILAALALLGAILSRSRRRLRRR